MLTHSLVLVRASAYLLLAGTVLTVLNFILLHGYKDDSLSLASILVMGGGFATAGITYFVPASFLGSHKMNVQEL